MTPCTCSFVPEFPVYRHLCAELEAWRAVGLAAAGNTPAARAASDVDLRRLVAQALDERVRLRVLVTLEMQPPAASAEAKALDMLGLIESGAGTPSSVDVAELLRTLLLYRHTLEVLEEELPIMADRLTNMLRRAAKRTPAAPSSPPGDNLAAARTAHICQRAAKALRRAIVLTREAEGALDAAVGENVGQTRTHMELAVTGCVSARATMMDALEHVVLHARVRGGGRG